MAYKKKTKKVKRRAENALAYVTSSFNNTIVTVTTPEGDILARGSCGSLGFKGSRKGTPFAASQVGSTIAREISPLGVKNIEVNMRGPGSGRESVVRALQAARFNVTVLRDVTPLPHNGCRAPKKRRV